MAAESVPWQAMRAVNRPEGELALNVYLDAPEPVPTGIPKLDQLLDGGMMRGVTVVGGPPSSGKSVLACQAAAMMATMGRRVVYASYEMSWDIVQLRCASAWSCTEVAKSLGAETFLWSSVANGSERRSRPAYAGKGRGELSRYLVGSDMDPITRTLTLWDEGPGQNVAVLTGGYDAHSLCEALASVEGERPVLVVDYLQIMPGLEDKGEQSEYQRVTDAINELQRYAYSRDGGNVLAISSTRNLSASDYKDGPNLTWYRGSGYVGFAAEQAVMLTVDRTKDGDGHWVPSIAANGMTEGHMTVIKNKTGHSNASVPTLMAGWCNLIQ